MTELEKLIIYWHAFSDIWDHTMDPDMRARIDATVNYLEELKKLKGE